MLELDVLNERELEDFLIDECMYAVSGFLTKNFIMISFIFWKENLGAIGCHHVA